MAEMNSDQILEVPDTPDRIQQSTCPASSSVVRRDVTVAAANPLPCRRIRFITRNNPMHGSTSQDNACSVLPAPSDTDHIFKQAEMARILALSEKLEAKFSIQKSDRTEISVENEKRAEKRVLDQNSSISDHISCSVTGGRSPSCRVIDGKVSEQEANHRNAGFLGVGSGLPTIPVGKPRNRTCTSTNNRLKGVAGTDICRGSNSGEVKGELVTKKAIAGPSSPPCGVPQRHVGPKKLVRNGCISPSNIAKNSANADEKQEMCSQSGHLNHPHPQLDAIGKGNVIDLTDNSPIMTRQRYAVKDKLISGYSMDTRAAKKLRTDRAGKTLIPQSVYHANSKNCSELGLSGSNNKGKEISSDILDVDQIGEANLRRISLSAAGTYSVVNNNSPNMDEEQGWKTTHNHTSKLPISLMGKLSCNSERESGSSAPSSQDHGSGAPIMASNRVRNKPIMIGRGRSKYASTSSHPDESSSARDEPEASFIPSSKITAGRNHTSLRHDIPVITINDIPAEATSSSSGYSNGASVDPTVQAQLESDELLARQLQEQLYNESPCFAPTEEIDAIVAMSLQHEEDTHHTSRPVRRSPNNTRGARVSRLNALRAELATTNRMVSHLQNIAPVTFRSGPALARYPAASRIQPNIDLNDYDALLALDENNHQHTGASESQINNLPQSVVQLNSIQEPCAVCLENPSVGDIIRHLPCFHKFHKECIDEWLRRKKLCPICKSGIR
ncbi:hypothetical protein SEVIR_7G172000v4 [Setaria viridis]|uniref:RING-type domain-containing protein n=2 Tax=Setaria viridis TaxID=4556 RepID=A0A4U6U5B6_SETVI|nr:E3 ubiquitin-protein ligase RNF12-like [Setaria viridis]TKW05387.1 hypothetical protein SEVIR_7G172000v2 [Setaria viridis]